MRELGREELRTACRAHQLPDEGRDRRELTARLLEAADFDPRASTPPAAPRIEGLPAVGDVVALRHRQWLVEATDFVRQSWPFGAPYPALYYDARALIPGTPYSSMHAKCVVIDAERAFLSSANFTARGQERNIEAGVLLHDPSFAEHLAHQWLGLIASGHLRPWTPPAPPYD